MIFSTSTGQIYLRVSNEADDQQHQIVIQPPIYCTLKRFSRYTPTQDQQSIPGPTERRVNGRKRRS